MNKGCSRTCGVVGFLGARAPSFWLHGGTYRPAEQWGKELSWEHGEWEHWEGGRGDEQGEHVAVGGSVEMENRRGCVVYATATYSTTLGKSPQVLTKIQLDLVSINYIQTTSLSNRFKCSKSWTKHVIVHVVSSVFFDPGYHLLMFMGVQIAEASNQEEYCGDIMREGSIGKEVRNILVPHTLLHLGSSHRSWQALMELVSINHFETTSF